MAAEIEPDLISQRTKEALRFKKEQGLTFGRPKGPGKNKLDAFRPEIESLLANGSTQRFIAQRYHTTEGESPQLAQEEWDEDAQSPYVIVSNIEKRPRERVI
jgi:DNA invertase Pin-like site-specific DNA recombinase